MKFNNVVNKVRPVVGKRVQMMSSLAGDNTSRPTKKAGKQFSSLVAEYDSEPESYGLDPSVRYTPVEATWRQLCDFELIANGGFAPLNGFLKQNDYENVCANYRLSNGALWPIPIVMDIDEKTKAHLEDNDGKLLLTDSEGVVRGILHVEDIWRPDKDMEANLVYGGNPDHCEIINIKENINEYYVSGEVEVLSLPEYEDFQELRRTPADVKQFFKDNNWDKVVAFQTRNPMHFAHIELTKLAAERIGAKVRILGYDVVFYNFYFASNTKNISYHLRYYSSF